MHQTPNTQVSQPKSGANTQTVVAQGKVYQDDISWYIVQQPSGQCEIQTLSGHTADLSDAKSEQWGPYGSKSEAIAKRVGLIRAGKCQPM